MAATTPILPQMPYSRRVSFSNIRPDDLESGAPPDVTRFHSYSMAPKKEVPLSQDPELAKLFSSYSLSSKASSQRKKQKLPEPPSKSILKNKLSTEQVKLNFHHASQKGVPSSPNLTSGEMDSGAIADESDSDSDGNSPLASTSTSRRKSYSNMTYDELLALDPQFSKSNKSNLDDFKFDPLGTTFSTQRRGSTTGANAATATTKSKAIAYPTSNENNYKSVSLTVKHQDFDHDIESHRTILTVISGRKHTWNAIDWLLLTDDSFADTQSFLQNGDHLVVSALVPLKYLQAENKGTTKKKDCAEKKIQQKGEDILAYILNNIPNTGIRLKITVELVMDVSFPDNMTLAPSAVKKVQTGTKFMMSHLFRQYQPTLVVVGNKSTSLNFKYPRRKSKSTTTGSTPRSSISAGSSIGTKSSDNEVEQYLVKLSSYFVRYSTIPVIMVGNSTIFHKKPPPKYMPIVTFRDESSKSQGILEVAPTSHRHDSYCSDISIESFCGERLNGGNSESSSLASSSESPPSISPSPTDRYAAMISAISSTSLSESRTYLESIRAEKIPSHFFDSKVHQAYVSMEQGRQSLLSKTNSIGATGRAYRVKSLISYNEEDEKENEKKIRDKKLKKSISQSSTGSKHSGELEDETKVTKIKKLFFRKIGRKKS